MNRKISTIGIGFVSGVIASTTLKHLGFSETIVFIVSAAVTFLIIVKGK